MPRFFQSVDNPESGTILLTGENAHHISFSLRMRKGEELTVCDGQGIEYRCEISMMDGETVTCRILHRAESVTESPVKIRLYQSVPKGDKLDYIVQKAVELGVSEIVPVYSSRCIVKPDRKTEEKKITRLSKIASEAAKQCGRGRIPKFMPFLSYAEALEEASKHAAFICYEDEQSYSLKEYLLTFQESESKILSFFVGPEGGYAKEEIARAYEKGIKSVKLGNRILRSETASGFVLSCMTYALEL